MKLPVGMLIFWAHRFSEDHAVISGMWYHGEMYVPSTTQEKIQSINDLKSKRSIVLNISGTFNQILDVLMQADRFLENGLPNATAFSKVLDELNCSAERPVLFDDIYKVKGTSLALDTVIDVDTDMEQIRTALKSWKPVLVYISEGWSFANEIRNSFQ